MDSNSISAERSLSVTVTLAALRQMPMDQLDPAESQTRMINVFPSQSPLAPVARLLRGTRLGYTEDVGRLIRDLTAGESNNGIVLGRLHGVLPQGVTASFHLIERNPVDIRSPEKLEIQIYRGLRTGAKKKEEQSLGSMLEIALVATGKIKQHMPFDREDVEDEADEKGNADQIGQQDLVTETILLKTRQINEREELSILLPSSIRLRGTEGPRRCR